MATETITINEEARATALRDAETKAVAMFNEIIPMIEPGINEKALSDQIHRLGQEKHNVRTHWHKRIVRSGPNTLRPFEDNPPDRALEAGDILVVDLGPVFEAWEADFGRSYIVPGYDENDEKVTEKLALAAALEPMWHKIKARYEADPDITGDGLWKLATGIAEDDGWVWGAPLAGHIVGELPHERIPKDKITHYIIPGNKQKIDSTDKKGRKLHWILEVHLRPKHEEYGAFFEQLLTVD